MSVLNAHAPVMPCMDQRSPSTVLYVLVDDENRLGQAMRVYAGIVKSEDVMDRDHPRYAQAVAWVAQRGSKLRYAAARLHFPGLVERNYAH